MASRSRAATTRRARYGTVVRPTNVASRRAADARTIVPQTLPDSRETVENSAAANASTRPTIATRKRTQTSGIPIRSNEEDVEPGALWEIMEFLIAKDAISAYDSAGSSGSNGRFFLHAKAYGPLFLDPKAIRKTALK